MSSALHVTHALSPPTSAARILGVIASSTQPRQQLALDRFNLGEHCDWIREQQDQGKDIGRPHPPKESFPALGMTIATESGRFPLLESFLRFALFLKYENQLLTTANESLIIAANGFTH